MTPQQVFSKIVKDCPEVIPIPKFLRMAAMAIDPTVNVETITRYARGFQDKEEEEERKMKQASTWMNIPGYQP